MKQINIVICVILLASACHRRIAPIATPVSKSIHIKEIEFQYLDGKARLSFREKSKESEVKAHIRIRKDSVIWMSLNFVGVQGGKALINKDSITVLSNLKKEYYVWNYLELSSRFNFKVNYRIIQQSLLGNLILPIREQDQVEEGTSFNRILQQEGSVTIQSLVNKITNKIEHVDLVETITGNSIKINYSDFQLVGDNLFPYKRTIEVIYKMPDGIVNNIIEFDYRKVEVETEQLRFPFKIPNRYDRR
jgi:hypothetical protein